MTRHKMRSTCCGGFDATDCEDYIVCADCCFVSLVKTWLVVLTCHVKRQVAGLVSTAYHPAIRAIELDFIGFYHKQVA